MGANDYQWLRDQLTRIDREHARAVVRVDAIGRELQRALLTIGELRGEVDEMTRTDEIAAAVARELERARRQRFTVKRKTAAAVAAVIVLIPAIHDAVTWWVP